MVTSTKAVAPVIRMPDDPENGLLSKEEFKAKMRKKRELDAKMKAYERTARAEIEKEIEEPVSKESVEEIKVDESTEPKAKRGRKPKVEV